MEITFTGSRSGEKEKKPPSPTASPHSNGSSLHPNPTPPLTPRTPVSGSQQANTCPTTFVQADTTSFKQVVQMLTGSDSHQPHRGSSSSSSSSIPPIKSTGQKKQGFKLYERRNSLKNGLVISTLIPGFSQNSRFSPGKPEMLSPSMIDFPALVLSPITPLNEDTLTNSMGNSSEEEKAIAAKKFYFHPSPRPTPTGPEPRLLPLFPGYSS